MIADDTCGDSDFNYCDKHIVIKDGHLATQFYRDELTIHDSEGPELSDGKWHQVEVF